MISEQDQHTEISLPVVFEEFVETKNTKKVNVLRQQLAIVDKAINLIGTNHFEVTTNELNDRKTIHSKTHNSMTKYTSSDQSYRIDTMSSQLATCPHCLQEMDAKKLRSHVSHSCPNKLVTCPELNCGVQLTMKHLRRHLRSECAVAMKRRALVAEAEQRKEAEAQRVAMEIDQRRLQVTASMDALMPEILPTLAVEAAAAACVPGEQPERDLWDEEMESRHTMCTQCGESMRLSQMPLHRAKLCIHRPVMCPNFHLGCLQRLVPLHLLQQHLASECAAEKHRSAMIARSQHRQELVKCPACGERVVLMLLRKHEKELCTNRRVRCRNHPLGCTVMVRLRERAQHERVDTQKAVRTALYMPSHGAHLAIQEDDIPCPWTAEYWIYRPPVKESLKTHLRNVFLLLPKYNVAFAAEFHLKTKVLRIVQELHAYSSASDAMVAADGGKLSKEQRAQRARDLAQSRVDLVNNLSALVPVYAETVLAYTRAFQELAVSVEAGLACAVEITSEAAFRDTEAESLRIRYPGSVAAVAQLDLSYLSPSKGGRKSAMNSTIVSARSVGSAALSSVASSTAGGVRLLDGLPQVGNGADDVQQAMLDAMEPLNLNELDSQNDDLREEDGACDGSEFGQAAKNVESGTQENSEGENSDQTDAEDCDALMSEHAGAEASDRRVPLGIVTSISPGTSQASTARRPGKKAAPRFNLDSVVTYLATGSTLASLFQACLHAENERVFHEAILHYHSKLAEGCAEEPSPDALQGALVHPDLDLAYLFPRATETAFPDSPGDAEVCGSPGAQIHRVSVDNISLGVRELQASGVAAFLADVVLAPKRGVKESALPWSSWLVVLQLLARGLKADFDALQGWRVQAGLLKPDGSRVRAGTGSKLSAEQQARQEKALEKKEKARLKRELKKQEKLQGAQTAAVPEEPMNPESTAAVGMGAATAGVRKDDGLFKRVGELLKAGCGAGVMAEASSRSTVPGERSYTKICMSLGSGLSILAAAEDSSRPQSNVASVAASPISTRPGTAEVSLDGVEEDHHYDLLLRPQDLSRLARSAGKIGVVAISHTMGELTGLTDAQLQQADAQEDSDGTETSQPPSPLKNALRGAPNTASSSSAESKREHTVPHRRRKTTGTTKKASSLARVGIEARSFDIEVPRGRWTHLAFVATALPQNKLTLYMDGLLIKTLKDCAFPLPMSALGGGTQSFETFEGALLDVRYWNVQRSSLEIINDMHRLLELEKDGIPGNNPRGLVGWWTFEDGGGKTAAADVTGHRFKTRIARRQQAMPNSLEKDFLPCTTATIAPGATATQQQGSAGAAIQDGFFTQEETSPNCLPAEVQSLLPASFQQLLPQHEGALGTAGFEAKLLSAEEGGLAKPWEAWLQALPRWNWLDAETLPTPQLPAGVRQALDGKASKKSQESSSAMPPPARKTTSTDQPTPPKPGKVPTSTIGVVPSSSSAHSVLPVPSLRARGICPYELRRHRLALKGRELQKEVVCPLGCSERVRAVEVRFHTRFACQRRIVPCRFEFCSGTFPVEQRTEHEQTECQHLFARNKVLSLAELHATIFPCSLCSAGVRQRDLEQHERYECPHRLVRCVYADCPLSKENAIPAHLLKHHTRFECASNMRKERHLLVERARTRLNYPRPWGFAIDEAITEEKISVDVQQFTQSADKET